MDGAINMIVEKATRPSVLTRMNGVDQDGHSVELQCQRMGDDRRYALIFGVLSLSGAALIKYLLT